MFLNLPTVHKGYVIPFLMGSLLIGCTLASHKAQAGIWDRIFKSRTQNSDNSICKEALQPLPPKAEVKIIVDPKTVEWIDSLGLRERLKDEFMPLASYQDGQILEIWIGKNFPSEASMNSGMKDIQIIFDSIPMRFSGIFYPTNPIELPFKVSIQTREQRDLLLIILSEHKDFKVLRDGPPFG